MKYFRLLAYIESLNTDDESDEDILSALKKDAEDISIKNRFKKWMDIVDQ